MALRELIVKLGLNTSGWAKGWQQAGDESSSGLNLIKSAVSELAGALTVGGVIAGLKSVVNTAATFQAEMNKVKALSGATAEQMKVLSAAAVEMGAKTSFSAMEAAQGMQNLAAAGFSTQQTLEAMPGVLDAAAASGIGLAQTAELIVSTLGGFGLAATEATHVADVLASAANASTASMGDLGNSLKYVAPVAAASGISLEQVAAALTVLANSGIKSEQAGTTLRSMLTSIVAPSAAAAASMKAAGLSFFDAAGHMKDFDGITAELTAKLGGMTAQQRNATIATVFGEQALSGALAMMKQGAPVIEKLATGFKNVDGASKEMAETMKAGLLGAVEELTGGLESLAITLGTPLLDPLEKLTDESTGLIGDLTDIATGTMSLAGILNEHLIPSLGKFGTVIEGLPIVKQLIALKELIEVAAVGGRVLTAIAQGDLAGVAAAVAAWQGKASVFAGASASAAGSTSAFASGGIVNSPQLALIGEAGAEAVVPLAGDPFQNLAGLLGIRAAAGGMVAGGDYMGGSTMSPALIDKNRQAYEALTAQINAYNKATRESVELQKLMGSLSGGPDFKSGMSQIASNFEQAPRGSTAEQLEKSIAKISAAAEAAELLANDFDLLNEEVGETIDAADQWAYEFGTMQDFLEKGAIEMRDAAAAAGELDAGLGEIASGAAAYREEFKDTAAFQAKVAGQTAELIQTTLSTAFAFDTLQEGITELSRSMHIADGAVESLFPQLKNAGALWDQLHSGLMGTVAGFSGTGVGTFKYIQDQQAGAMNWLRLMDATGQLAHTMDTSAVPAMDDMAGSLFDMLAASRDSRDALRSVGDAATATTASYAEQWAALKALASGTNAVGMGMAGIGAGLSSVGQAWARNPFEAFTPGGGVSALTSMTNPFAGFLAGSGVSNAMPQPHNPFAGYTPGGGVNQQGPGGGWHNPFTGYTPGQGVSPVGGTTITNFVLPDGQVLASYVNKANGRAGDATVQGWG